MSEEPTTLTDDEIVTSSAPQQGVSDDTGDDAGDVSDTSDTGDVSDTGDDSGSDE